MMRKWHDRDAIFALAGRDSPTYLPRSFAMGSRIMAILDTTRRPAAGSIWRLVSALVGMLTAWNDMRVTRKALSALSDRELADIGLTRADIETLSIGR